MKIQPAAFFRTALPMDLSTLGTLDSGRYHSIWLPDHMVSFWPDSIWTPEFTDLATTSASPHRHLDGLACAAAVAALTRNVPIANWVRCGNASTGSGSDIAYDSVAPARSAAIPRACLQPARITYVSTCFENLGSCPR
jgi:hypothetical protein